VTWDEICEAGCGLAFLIPLAGAVVFGIAAFVLAVSNAR